MREVKKIKSAEMFPVIYEILQGGGNVWITVTGMSMYPFLREDRDSALLAPVDFGDLKKGDIVLIRRQTGEYILHRVLRRSRDDFYMIGDAQQWIEGPLMPGQLVARVIAIKRENREIPCSNLLWRVLASAWLHIIPVRHILLKMIKHAIKARNSYFRRKNENTERI